MIHNISPVNLKRPELDGDKEVSIGIKPYLYAGFAIRCALIIYGDYHDRSSDVKFTDVDYHVFTDASRHVLNGGSPYDRHTYRYTPLLAWMLIPNLLISPLFGKLLFIACDLLVSFLIYYYLSSEGHSEKLSIQCSWVWLFNPIVMAVSTRGNADCMVVLLVLLTLLLYRERIFLLTGISLGLAIHFKIFPFLFSLPMYVALTDYSGLRGLFHINKARFRLVLGTVGTLVILTSIGYSFYGMAFIDEAYLHHVTRRDIRHNFSVYFYMLYLTVDVDDIGINLVAFLPQLILWLALSKKFGNISDMPMCVLCQTFVFVVFNKVCTSQYFLWYLAPLALVIPKLKLSQTEAGVLAIFWSFTQGAWLLPAYFLEFKGNNTFLFIWIESMTFFCANIGIMSKFVRKYLEQPEHQH